MQNPNRTIINSRPMLPRIQAATAGLHAHQLHIGIIDELGKHADGVRTATHAGHHHIRQPAGSLQQLRLGLRRNDLVEFAHYRRERVRARRGPQQVMRLVERCGPIPQRLIHRILQRARTGIHRHHLRPHELHAIHVRLLPRHILLPHVDHTIQSEQCTRQRRCRPVLSRPGFGNDPGFPHAFGKQRLTNHLVGFMRAPMH